jgi:hypothetical protein
MRYGVETINLTKKDLDNSVLIKMGLFGSDIQTVSVNQAADGKATTDVSVSVPLWEVAVVAMLMSIIIYICCACSKKFAKKQFEKAVQKHTVPV